MSFKAIIFDMDGTIIDTTNIWKQATLTFIKNQGKEISPEAFESLDEQFHGLAITEVCTIIKDKFGLSCSIQDMIHEKSTIACSLYETGITFIDGFPEFHAQLSTYNLLSGVATNADNSTLALAKKAMQLDSYFGSHIYNISYVNNVCKPDPAIYLYAAKQLGIEPELCLAIEDSAHGIKAAQTAGMKCIGINTSKNYQQVKNADIIVDTYTEIDLKKLINR